MLWAYRLRLTQDPTPGDFDFGFFNAAPIDQQVESLPAEIPIALEGLSPDHARLESRIPPYRARIFRARPGSGEAHEIEARCDTLWIDTDRSLAVVAWRGVDALEGPDEQAAGTIVIAAEAGDERITGDDVKRMAESAALKAEVTRAIEALHKQ